MSSHPNRGIHTLSSHSNGRPPFLNERPLLAESSIDPIRGNAQTMRLPPLSSIYQPPAQILNACAGLPFDPNIRLMRLTNFSRLTNTSNLSRSIPTQSNQNIAGTNNPAFCPPTPFQLCSQNNSFPLRSAYPQQAVPSHPAHGLTPPKDLNPRMVLSDSTMHNAAALAPMNAHPSSFKRTLDNRDLRKPSLFRPSQPVKASSLHPLRSPSPLLFKHIPPLRLLGLSLPLPFNGRPFSMLIAWMLMHMNVGSFKNESMRKFELGPSQVTPQ
ncbi:hypothetical protein E1B28_002739 [Marasmius oreades]|uniref:Uncharacterized protein n=1 Tax=Marasmius oreades TaxID=181124 RepID=A0A9P7RNC8_9AGAR|nr:uncharacterized protein E1B28_002739 [Marasmius oreades]KAG7086816.1 hypothetical protein E1B28_002739 [Marasmius oreades]